MLYQLSYTRTLYPANTTAHPQVRTDGIRSASRE